MSGMHGEVRLGGRLFNVINYDVITVINEAYIHKLMRETGLDIPLPFNDAESDVEYQVRLQARVVDTLKLPELLGGFLLPAGMTEATWTPAVAAETAKYISGLTAREDRDEVFRLAYLVNVYFFREGLISLRNSQSSLSQSAELAKLTGNSPSPSVAH